MSVIIKGMKLPKKSDRRECSIAVVQNRPVSIAFSRTKTNPFECFECAEIPMPHGRLIDADRFLKDNAEFADRDFIHPSSEVTLRELIDEASTIIEAEVE